MIQWYIIKSPKFMLCPSDHSFNLMDRAKIWREKYLEHLSIQGKLLQYVKTF